MKRILYDAEGNPAGESRLVRNNGKPVGTGFVGTTAQLIVGLFLVVLVIALLASL